jgi:hypothetical protein
MKTLTHFCRRPGCCAEYEDTLQISIRKLETVIFKCGLKVSTIKTKKMAFKGRDSVRNKFIINSDIIEQINTFTELVSSISLQNEEISKIYPNNGN